jgi:hypothetical protein
VPVGNPQERREETRPSSYQVWGIGEKERGELVDRVRGE